MNFIFSLLKTIFNKFKKFSFKDWLLFILCILCLVFFCKYRYYQNKTVNPIIYEDSIRIYKNKLGEEYKAKTVYIEDIKTLKQQNDELSEELKSLKDHPVVITKTYTNFVKDTIYAESDNIAEVTDINDSLKFYKLDWHSAQESEFYSMQGTTTVASDFSKFNTVITNLNVKNDITLDVVDNGKTLSVIAKSNNPYINIADIKSVVLDPKESKTLSKYYKPKRWGIGPYIGVGIDRKMTVSPQIGIGVTYSIFQF